VSLADNGWLQSIQSRAEQRWPRRPPSAGNGCSAIIAAMTLGANLGPGKAAPRLQDPDAALPSVHNWQRSDGSLVRP
jgi:hypothetical protein